MRLSIRLLLLVFLPMVWGCSSLSPVPPENFDLSGDWQLNTALSDSPSLANLNRSGGRKGRQGARRDGGGGQGRGAPPSGGGRQGGGRGRPSSQPGDAPGGTSARSGGRVRLGVLRSSTISIEQSHESMGMEFDNGVYRDVSWGTRVRGELTVETGWNEQELVIESRGGRMPVVERYAISDDGQRLRVVVELNGGRDDLKFLRIYEKRESIVPNQIHDSSEHSPKL